MIFVSYYTKNTVYEGVMNEYLLPSLKRWKLKYNIEIINDLGNWQKNTHYKAEFCKKMLLKHKQSIIFLDADATIEEYPYLFNNIDYHRNSSACFIPGYDIALHYLDWYFFWRKIEGQKKREALSGTLYLNYNKKVLQFLDEWIEENKKNTSWEQKNMQWVLRNWKKKLTIYSLSPEYCCIILPDGEIPYYYLKEKPVILHHQVSRKYKNG